MKRKILSILLVLCLVLTLAPPAAFAETEVPYLDADGTLQKCTQYTVVTSSALNWGSSGKTTWYVVQDDVTIGTKTDPQRVTVNGDVHLILTDGCTLTVNGGIQVEDNSTGSTPNTNALTIYGQMQPILDADGNVTNNVGKLIAQGAEPDANAAIGGNKGGSGGAITINGGIVEAQSSFGAAIGGGYGDGTMGGDGGSITINGGVVKAQSSYGAGIGGGSGAEQGGDGGSITINGGTVTATSTNGAGIGGGSGAEQGGDGGNIIITGGVVKAAGDGGAGIGGGFGTMGGDGGKITISGGTVTATATNYGAGIGGGGGVYGGDGGEVTINGGTVTATSTNGAGISVGYGDSEFIGDNGTFSTGTDGNAVLFASSICDQSGKNSWHGIIFEGTADGIIYGESVAPTDDFTIEDAKTLTIGEGQTLTIPEGVTMTIENSGIVENSGKIYVDGTLNGPVSGNGTVYYRLSLADCTATSGTISQASKTYATTGSQITLTSVIPTGQKFVKWEVSPAGAVTVGENNIFTMPSAALTIAAQFSPETYDVTLNTNGGTINSGDVTSYTYGTGATLPTDVTRKGYTFAGWYDNQELTGNPVTEIRAHDTDNKEYWAKWTANSTGGSSSSGGGFSGVYNYPVVISNVENGKATVDKTNAVAGDKVTITVTPDAGKAVDEVIVTDADGKAISVSKAGDNKYTFTMPAGKVNIAVTTKAADYQKQIVLQIGNRNILENNKTITNDVAPVIVDNRTMVPIRVITETLGGTADWDADTQTVTLNIDGKTLTMTIGQTISGFDTAPIILNDRTYVPVRYVAEKLGAMVEWIGESQQIIITK